MDLKKPRKLCGQLSHLKSYVCMLVCYAQKFDILDQLSAYLYIGTSKKGEESWKRVRRQRKKFLKGKVKSVRRQRKGISKKKSEILLQWKPPLSPRGRQRSVSKARQKRKEGKDTDRVRETKGREFLKEKQKYFWVEIPPSLQEAGREVVFS